MAVGTEDWEGLMIDFASSFTQFVLATFLPLYVGLLFVMLLRESARVNLRILSAFAFGLLFWFFLDTLNDAIQLNVNEGFSFGFHHTTLLLLFAVGFLSLALPSGLSLSAKVGAENRQYSFLVGILVSLGLGFHGIAEGLGFGATVAGTSATTVLDAIGGYSGGIAYVLHKFLEATIVMTVFVSLRHDEGLTIRKELWHLIGLGLAFGLPSALGDFVGYYVQMDSSYFFALGGGAALFVALLSTRPIFAANAQGKVTSQEWIRIVLAVLLGFLALYAAASLHAG